MISTAILNCFVHNSRPGQQAKTASRESTALSFHSVHCMVNAGRLKMGGSCTVRGRPVNIGPWALQMPVAKGCPGERGWPEGAAVSLSSYRVASATGGVYPSLPWEAALASRFTSKMVTSSSLKCGSTKDFRIDMVLAELPAIVSRRRFSAFSPEIESVSPSVKTRRAPPGERRAVRASYAASGNNPSGKPVASSSIGGPEPTTIGALWPAFT